MRKKRILGKIQPIYLNLLLSCLLFFQGLNSFAQEQNPFELTYRQLQKESVIGVSDNPFDKLNPVEIKTEEQVIQKPVLTDKSSNFFLLIGLLLLLALLLTFLRSFAVRSVGAFGTDNLFNFLYREMSGRGILPYLLLYIFFFINMGVIIYFAYPFIAEKMNKVFKPDFYILFLLPFFISGIKHLILTFVGFIFPVRKESDRYQFLMVVTGISIGLFISPINIFFPYLNDSWKQLLIYFVIFIVGLILLYHYLRGLTICVRFIGSHQFHFLLYICTVEIAPVLILVKLIINSL